MEGSWVRFDGPYTIEIIEIQAEGKLLAKYFNPNPINVGRSEWRIQDKTLQLYVELQDENYPGSIYQLAYDEDKDELSGTYYQAVARQTFEVYFTKEK